MSRRILQRASIEIGLVVVFFLGVVTTSAGQGTVETISALKFLGQYTFPHNRYFRNTVAGGFSGIDYDAARDQYYLICDDRSEMNVARFYVAHIGVTDQGIDTVYLTDFKPLLDSSARPYPGVRENRWRTPDPESIRYNKLKDELVWSSEGERALGKDTVLVNPFIQVMGVDGKYRSTFQLPASLKMQPQEWGPRQNGVLEGLSYSGDFSSLYACIEEPLYQDGPPANITETNSWVRIFRFDANTLASAEQYAYKLERVAYPAIPYGAHKVNGVSEILWVAPGKLLTVERSYSTGSFSFVIKVFLADLSKAENIAANPSLIKTPPKRAAVKKLVIDMSKLGVAIDNIEGVTFGPTLPNGHRTLLFVADNNFKVFEKNQFLLFEVMP